jgi:hypothetical protein
MSAAMNPSLPTPTVSDVAVVLSRLKNELHDVAVQCDGLTVLGRMAQHGVDFQTEVSTRGGLELVLANLKLHQKQAAVQQAGYFCLGWLAANHADNQSHLMSKGVLGFTLVSLKHHAVDPHVFSAGCFALRHLVSTDTARTSLVQQGARLLVHGLRMHWQSADAQSAGLQLTATLAEKEEDANRLLSHGLAMGLATAIRTHDARRDVLVLALTALAAIAVHAGTQSLIMEQCGGLVLAVANANPNDGPLQGKALGVVRRLTEQASNRPALLDLDVVTMLMQALRRHPNVVRVQREGLLTMAWLAEGSHDTAQQIVAAGGLDVVVASLQDESHAKDRFVRQTALLALGWLCHVQTNQVRAAEVGAVEAVCSVLQATLLWADVQATGVFALRALGGVAGNRARIQAARGLELVVAAMGAHPRDLEVQHKACVCLEWFAINHDTRAAIMSMGGATAVVRAMTAYPAAAHLQSIGCVVLSSLAALSANRVLMVKQGVPRVVRRALQSFPQHALVQEMGLTLLPLLAPAERQRWEVWVFVVLTIVLLATVYYFPTLSEYAQQTFGFAPLGDASP